MHTDIVLEIEWTNIGVEKERSNWKRVYLNSDAMIFTNLVYVTLYVLLNLIEKVMASLG